MGTIDDKFYDQQCKTSFYIDEMNSDTGPVVRWNTNNSIPFADMLERFHKDGLITAQELVNSIVQRDVEVAETIAQYKANYTPPDAEQMMEMRAAFGPDVEVVNVITGTKVRT